MEILYNLNMLDGNASTERRWRFGAKSNGCANHPTGKGKGRENATGNSASCAGIAAVLRRRRAGTIHSKGVALP